MGETYAYISDAPNVSFFYSHLILSHNDCLHLLKIEATIPVNQQLGYIVSNLLMLLFHLEAKIQIEITAMF